MPEDRRDDWHNSVDTRLVNLTSAQKSADIDLERLKRSSARDDKILRGDPERNIEGLIEAVNHLRNEINKFNRIFDKDYAGHGGLASFITYLYNRERSREKASDQNQGYKWAFWTAILAAIIGAVAVIVTNKDQLMKWAPKAHPDAVERKIERAKHPKSPHKIYVYRIVPSTSTKDPNAQ